MIARARKLILGETWSLPAGVALTLAGGLGLEALDPGWWHHLGGFGILAGAAGALGASLRSVRGGRRP